MTPTDPIEETASRLDWPRTEAVQRLVDHLAGRHQMSDETHILILEMESEMTRLLGIEAAALKAARYFAGDTDVQLDDIRTAIADFDEAASPVPAPTLDVERLAFVIYTRCGDRSEQAALRDAEAIARWVASDHAIPDWFAVHLASSETRTVTE